MITVDILTKENFWDELIQHYPKTMAIFFGWLAEYKTVYDWDLLLSGDTGHWEPGGPGFAHSWVSNAPKFHQMPAAVQHGIFLEFCQQYLANATVSGPMKATARESIEFLLMVINLETK